MLKIQRGLKVKSEGIELPNGEIMKDVEDCGCKYVGVLEGAKIKNRESKRSIRST